MPFGRSFFQAVSHYFDHGAGRIGVSQSIICAPESQASTLGPQPVFPSVMSCGAVAVRNTRDLGGSFRSQSSRDSHTCRRKRECDDHNAVRRERHHYHRHTETNAAPLFLPSTTSLSPIATQHSHAAVDAPQVSHNQTLLL